MAPRTTAEVPRTEPALLGLDEPPIPAPAAPTGDALPAALSEGAAFSTPLTTPVPVADVLVARRVAPAPAPEAEADEPAADEETLAEAALQGPIVNYKTQELDGWTW